MSLDLQIDTTELEALARRYANAEPFIENEMRKAMQQSVDVVEGQVKGRTPVNTGQLRNSIATQVKGNMLNMQGLIMSPLAYAIVMEEGRTPGAKQPPTGPIELWVIRKGIATAGTESRQAAYVIARSIGRKGIKGLFMFREGLKASTATINQIWLKMSQRVARELDK